MAYLEEEENLVEDSRGLRAGKTLTKNTLPTALDSQKMYLEEIFKNLSILDSRLESVMDDREDVEKSTQIAKDYPSNLLDRVHEHNGSLEAIKYRIQEINTRLQV